MNHQQHQVQIINRIEEQIKIDSLQSSTVSPVMDFERDPRICLTSAHFPSHELISNVVESIIKPLKKISPEHFYYSDTSLHITIKNVRLIHDPPNFTPENVKVVKKVFSEVIPLHRRFTVYFYRLLLFPHNLALIGTTEPELDKIVMNLNKHLKERGVPDDKQYVNSQYFFSNMTLVRFNTEVSPTYKKVVQELSKKININPYIVDSISLITANAVLSKLKIIDSWKI